MKSCIMGIFITAYVISINPVTAQDGSEYGSRLHVTSPVTYLECYRSNIECYNKQKIYTFFGEHQSRPVWSPDGQQIAFFAPDGIFIAPIEGGKAQLVYTQYYEHELGTIALGFSPHRINFSPDGKEIIFDQPVYDEDRGGEIEISRNEYGQWSGSRIAGTFDILSVSLETGEYRVIVEGGMYPGISHNGRYICYLNHDWRVWVEGEEPDHHGIPAIFDMETEKSWYLVDEEILPQNEGIFYVFPSFSTDDSHIIVDIGNRVDSDNRSNMESQLYTIPLQGGKPEQMTFWEGNPEWGKVRNFPRYSPDGLWILCTDNTQFKQEDGTYKESIGMSLFNVDTRETFGLFESGEFSSRDGRWSPDGTKICYSLRDSKDDYRIYIKEVVFDNLIKLSGNPTLVEYAKPLDVNIFGNYPNPFNPATTIEFSLHRTGFAELAIYNLAGQKIRELVLGTMSEGIYSVVWNGFDDNGLLVSAGVYMSRLKMGDAVTTGRMLLVK